MLGVGVTGGVAAVLVEQSGSVVAQRLQQSVSAGVADGVRLDHRPIDELHHQIGRLAPIEPLDQQHRLGGPQVEPAGEHRQQGEAEPLAGVEQIERPLDRGAQRLMPGRGPATAGQPVEPFAQRRQQPVRTQRPHPCRGELHRQRQPVETLADHTHRRRGRRGRRSRRRRRRGAGTDRRRHRSRRPRPATGGPATPARRRRRAAGGSSPAPPPTTSGAGSWPPPPPRRRGRARSCRRGSTPAARHPRRAPAPRTAASGRAGTPNALHTAAATPDGPLTAARSTNHTPSGTRARGGVQRPPAPTSSCPPRPAPPT